MHEQIWVKVNAPVDAGAAEITSVLNEIEGRWAWRGERPLRDSLATW